jgi:adenosine deaminase
MRAAHGLSDEQLAELARMSARASGAPDDVRSRMLSDIDDWLRPPVPGVGAVTTNPEASQAP